MGRMTSLFNPAAWVDALLPGRSAQSVNPSDRSPTSDFWYQSTFGLPNLSGVVGGQNSWMFVSTSVAAMRLLCGIGADMPLERKQMTKVGGKNVTNVMENDPVHRLLNMKATPTMLSKSFKSQMVGWQVGWGTAFAEIERDLATGRPKWLWPIHPCRPTAFINDRDGTLWWKIQNPMAEPSYIPDIDMLRIPYTLMDEDGLHGLGIGKLAAQSIGLGQTLEKTEAKASSSALPRIVVEHEKRMQLPEQEAFRRQWAEWSAGGENTPVLLVDGAKAKPLNWAATDTDHRQRREFNQRDLARWFGVPEDVLNGTNDMTLLFQKTSLHYLEIWEQACDDKLLNESDRESGQYWQNDYRSLLKADPVARSQYWTNRVSIGSTTPNEVRYGEGDNPSTTDGADVEYIQGAMRRLSDPYKTGAENPIGQPKEGKAPPLAPKKPGKAAKAIRAAREAVAMTLADRLTMLASREMKQVKRDSGKPHDFLTKVEAFYAEHAVMIAKEVEFACSAAAATGWRISGAEIARNWCEKSMECVLEASNVKAVELSTSVELAVADWNSGRVTAFVEGLRPKNKGNVPC